MLFAMDEDGEITHRFATYFGARLLTQEWTAPDGGYHELYPAYVNLGKRKGETVVTAYAVKRPAGEWALLVINKDPVRSFSLHSIVFRSRSGTAANFRGPVDLFQFSPAQYQLNADPNDPYPIKADPPAHTVVQSDQANSLALPPYSLTVVRGAGPRLAAQIRKRF
jgi:hypothetical protein